MNHIVKCSPELLPTASMEERSVNVFDLRYAPYKKLRNCLRRKIQHEDASASTTDRNEPVDDLYEFHTDNPVCHKVEIGFLEIAKQFNPEAEDYNPEYDGFVLKNVPVTFLKQSDVVTHDDETKPIHSFQNIWQLNDLPYQLDDELLQQRTVTADLFCKGNIQSPYNRVARNCLARIGGKFYVVQFRTLTDLFPREDAKSPRFDEFPLVVRKALIFKGRNTRMMNALFDNA